MVKVKSPGLVGWNAFKYPSISLALVVTSIFALLPAIGIIAWSGLEYGNYFVTRAQEDAIRQVESFAEFQNRVATSAENFLSILASLPEFISLDYDGMIQVLNTVQEHFSDYHNITVVNTNKRVVASLRLAPGYDFSGRRHFKIAIEEDRFAAGEYMLAAVQ